MGAVGQLLTGEATTAGGSVVGTITSTVDSLPGNFLNSLESAGGGALGSFLAADLINALGITGVPGQFLTSVSSFAIGKISTNLIQSSGNLSTAFNGISYGTFGGAIGSFVGAQLGAALYDPSTIQGQEGAQVGTTLGSLAGLYAAGDLLESQTAATLLGSEFLAGFAFAGVGALVGFVLGGLIGDWFGHSTPQAFANIDATTNGAGGTAYALSNDYTQDGGDQDTASALGVAATTALNEVLATVGGTVTAWAQPYGGYSPIGFGIGTYTVNGTLDLTYQLHYGQQFFFNPSTTTLDQLVSFAVFNQLSQMQFSGGDPYMERAIDAAMRTSTMPSLQTLTGDIQIAKDYETYVQNENVINALIAADPMSTFSAGWVTELAIAGSMGYGTSVQGSAGNDMLSVVTTGNITDNVLIGGGGNDTYNFTTGNGQVTILNGVSTYNIAAGSLNFTNTNYGNSIYVPFAGGGGYYEPNSDHITFSQSGADLVVSINGNSTDQVTVEGWFAGSFEQLSSINFADNKQVAASYLDAQFNVPYTIYGPPTADLGVADTNALANSSTTVTAGNGADVLTGSTSNDTFIAGGGTDIIYGGGGTDTYDLNYAGNLTIYNNVTTGGTVMGAAASGALNLGAGVTAGQLSFARTANDLTIAVSGSTSQVTVKNWFANAYSQLQTITASDGVQISFSNNYPYGIYSFQLSDSAGNYPWSTQTQYYNALNQEYQLNIVNDNGSSTQQTFDTTGSQTYTSYTNEYISSNQLTGVVYAFRDGSSLTVTSSNTVTIANNQTNNAGSSAINITGSGRTDTINGSNDYISIGAASDTTTVNGTFENINSVSGAKITLGSGAGATLDGNGDTVTQTTNSGLTVSTGNTDTVKLTGTGNTLTESGGTSITVSANNAGETINGSNDTIQASGNGDTVTLTGSGDTISSNSANNTTVNVNGSGGTTTIASRNANVTVNGSADTINATGQNFNLTIAGTGNGDTINGSSGNVTVLAYGQVNLNGTSNTIATTNNSNAVVNFLANATGTVTGTGNSIGVIGTGVNVTASGETITTAANSSFTLNGVGDVINLGTGARVTFSNTNGGPNTDSVNATLDTVTLLNGTQATIAVNGGSNTITANGNNYNVSITGTGSNADTVNGSSGTVTIDSNSQANLTGTSNTVNLASNSAAAVVRFLTNASGTVNGTGSSVGIVGTGINVTASGETVSVATGSTFTLTGNSNSVTDTANTSTILYGSANIVGLNGANYTGINSGTGDTINNVVSGDTVNLSSNTSTTVNGSGGAIGAVGTGITVYASNEGISSTSGAYFTVQGDSNGIADSTSTTTVVYGSNENIALNGSDTIGINSGIGETITNDVSGDVVNLTSNTSATVNGSGGSVGLIGTGITLTASNEGVSAAAGTAATIYGSGDGITGAANATFTVYGTGNTYTLATGDVVTSNITTTVSANVSSNGTNGFVSGSSGNIFTVTNAPVSEGFVLAGTNPTLNLPGTTQQGNSVTVCYMAGTATIDATWTSLNIAGNETVNLTGNVDYTTLGTGDVFTQTGGYSNVYATTGDEIRLNNGANVVTVAANSTGVVIASSGNTINLGAGANVTVVGNNNTITGSSDTLLIQGTGNGVTDPGGTVTYGTYGGPLPNAVIANPVSLTQTTGTSSTASATTTTSTPALPTGTEHYQFDRGDASTTITNGLFVSAAPSNELDFGSGITDENLWFVKSGNDLRIDLMGTKTAVTVKDWYSGSGRQLQEITAGGEMIDAQLSQLVQAMASFSASNGFDPTAVPLAPSNANLQAVIAAAWHP